MTNKIKTAVVGVGYLGKFHAQIYARMPNVELVGVMDTDQQQAQAIAKQCQCQVFTDTQQLLDKINAVSIVVPTIAHLEVARPFLDAGIHMLLEKPIAVNQTEGQAIIDLATQSGAILQIGHLERFNAGVMALAERITQARFFEAHRMGEFVARATDVDVVSDLMIHDIDIILSLVPAKISQISAMGASVLTNHIDIANARLEFDNGCVANVTASRVSNKRLRRIRVFEKQHYLALNFIDQQLETVYAQSQTTTDGEWPEIVQDKIQIDAVKPLDAELAEFINACQNQQIPRVTGEVGLEALRVALLVKNKIEQSIIDAKT